MRGRRTPRRFTPEQREACYRLVLEGMSAAKASDLLGSVGFGRVEPFTISAPSVRRIANEITATREDNHALVFAETPLGAVDRMTYAAVRLAEDQLIRLRQREARGHLKASEIRQFAIALRDLRTEVRKIGTTQAQANDGESAPSSEDQWLASLDTNDDAMDPKTEAELEQANAHRAKTQTEIEAARENAVSPTSVIPFVPTITWQGGSESTHDLGERETLGPDKTNQQASEQRGIDTHEPSVASDHERADLEHHVVPSSHA